VKIDVYCADDPLTLRIAESWTRALRYYGHDAGVVWHPSEARDRIDMGFEIGRRFMAHHLGVPFVHYVVDAMESIPGQWIDSMLKGHIFFFADYLTSVKAHQQGVRIAEYLPLGADSLAPQRKIEGPYEHEFFIGHMGNPTPDVLHRLHEVKEYKPDARIAIWGRKELWEPTDHSSSFVGEIPDTNTLFDELNRCRFYLSNCAGTSPDYFFMQAMHSQKCMGIAPFNSSVWECFEQSRFLFGPAHLRSFFKDINSKATYENEKEDQIRVVSHGPDRVWTTPLQAIHCAPHFNRIIDRAFHLFTVLDKKDVYKNAKGACPPNGYMKPVLDKPKAHIIIKYPEEDKAAFVLKFDGVKVEELPLLLRRVARNVERTYIEGKMQINTETKEMI